MSAFLLYQLAVYELGTRALHHLTRTLPRPEEYQPA